MGIESSIGMENKDYHISYVVIQSLSIDSLTEASWIEVSMNRAGQFH